MTPDYYIEGLGVGLRQLPTDYLERLRVHINDGEPMLLTGSSYSNGIGCPMWCSLPEDARAKLPEYLQHFARFPDAQCLAASDLLQDHFGDGFDIDPETNFESELFEDHSFAWFVARANAMDVVRAVDRILLNRERAA